MRALRVVPLAIVLGLFVTASSASAGWVQDGINWQAWPSGASGGIDCFGNCGAGCSNKANPCGGPKQYWSLSYVAGPNVVGQGIADYCVDYGDGVGAWYTETWNVYNAIGRWTYHGWVKPGCLTHDVYCNQWKIGCVVFFGCGDPGWTDTWSYDQWMVGTKHTSNTFVEWAPCN